MPADSPVTFHRRVVLGLSAAYATALVGLLSSAVPPRTVEDDTVFEFSHIISDLFGYPTNSRLSCGDSSSYDDARVAQFCGLAAFAVLAVSEALGSVFWGNNQSSAPSNGLSQLTLPSAIFGTVSYAALAANSSPLGAGDASSFRADLARLLYLCFSTALHTYSLWTVGETSLAFLLRGLGFNAMMFLAGLTASMSSGVLMYASLAAFCCCFVGIGHHTWNLFGGGIREPHANNEAILEMKLLLFAVWVALLGGFVHQLLGKSHIYAEAAIVAAEVMNATIVISAYRHGVICMASDREHVLSQEKAVQMVAELKTRVARQERNFAELTQELRSPLHGMMGMIEVLLMKHSKEMSAQCISAVQAVRDAGARYQHLITNILDSCSVESISRNDLAYERVDFVSLLASVCQLLEPLLHSNTKLRSVVQDDLVIVEADSTCLMRIMFNLLGNAAKFTEAGKIAVYVSTASNSLHIQVKDSGTGIVCTDHQGAIPEALELYGTESSTPRMYGGWGLGLIAAQRLIRAHDGRLTVQSEQGQGTTFTVQMPLKAPPASQVGQAVLKPSGSRVSALRTEAGPRTDVAQNPLSIRSTACQPSGIPRRNTVHTSKPSGEDALDARRGFLEGWLDARRKEALKTLNEAELPAEPEAFEILSVDDKTIDQAVIREVMAVRGFRVTPAFSGIQALNILEKRDKEGGDFPHLILMDTMMPNMTWAETTKIIRKTYGFGIPIILMSNANDEAHITKLVQEGCNDFLVKPFKAAELLARVGLQTRLLQIAAQQLESDKHEALLREILPVSVIERLKGGQQVIADELDEVTVVFSDIVGFTDLTSKVTTTAVIGMLDSLFTQLDGLTDKHGVYKVETIGDCYMLVAGHDADSRHDHAARAIRIAMDMVEVASKMTTPLGDPLRLRVGMHSGPVHAGVVGWKGPRYCLFGDTVNTASRMESTGFPMCIHMSDSTYTIAQAMGMAEQVEFIDLGMRGVKGKGQLRTWLLKYGSWEEAMNNHREGWTLALRAINHPNQLSQKCPAPDSTYSIAASTPTASEETFSLNTTSSNGECRDSDSGRKLTPKLEDQVWDGQNSTTVMDHWSSFKRTRRGIKQEIRYSSACFSFRHRNPFKSVF